MSNSQEKTDYRKRRDANNESVRQSRERERMKKFCLENRIENLIKENAIKKESIKNKNEQIAFMITMYQTHAKKNPAFRQDSKVKNILSSS